jgi:hypothetical protein
VITSDTDAIGRVVLASEDESQYLVRSEKGGGLAVRRRHAGGRRRASGAAGVTHFGSQGSNQVALEREAAALAALTRSIVPASCLSEIIPKQL